VDAHHSVVDPQAKAAYEDESRANEQFIRQVVRAADGYQRDHSKAAALCAIYLLDNAARQEAFTQASLGKGGARDGFYVQAFYLDGLSLAYLKVSPSGLATARQTEAIRPWLIQMAQSVRNFYDEMARQQAEDGHNNLTYWGALGVASVGIAVDRHDLFDWAIGKYRIGVSEIRSDGTLPLEMNRASLALHYHLFAVAPLVLLAELGERNGLDLYADADGALHRLVRRAAAGLQDPSFFQEQTGVPQQMPEELGGSVIGWAVPYESRYPGPLIEVLLNKAKSTSYWQIGGLPPK
jgi:poly(beta-D-mannuronate) lyase